jgi:Protein of unknown function (DUF3089)
MSRMPLVAALLLAALTCAPAPASAAAASSGAGVKWLCRPGLKPDPCTPGFETTRISATGDVLGTFMPAAATAPKVDCFYVYPTVSNQPRPQATLRVDPELRSVARFQAARYGSECRIFAPLYRQVTLYGLLNPKKVTARMRAQGYADVRRAFLDYLARDNRGRGIVFIGHSQGTAVLRRLLAEEVDGKAAVRRRLVSALLLGGNVLVKKGQDTGGDFHNIKACRTARQLRCVVAFSTFNAAPPAGALFGRPRRILGYGPKRLAGDEVLCTNPAALGGGSAPLDAIYPSVPFAPGTAIGVLTTQVGMPVPEVSTPWLEADGAYTATCSSEGGANVLRITPSVEGLPPLKALPAATWGLHLVDANIALGNLVNLVHGQAEAYTAA